MSVRPGQAHSASAPSPLTRYAGSRAASARSRSASAGRCGEGVAGGGDVHRRVDGDPARVGGPVLRRVRRDDRDPPVGACPGQEALVEPGHLGERRHQPGVGLPGRLGVLHERQQQPVRARRPHVERIGALEVVRVPRHAVRVGRGDDAARPEHGPRVVPPVVQLPVHQRRVRLHHLRQVGGGRRRGLEVQVGVGGERPGPGGVPVAGPQPHQPGRQHPARRQQVVAARREQPLRQRRPAPAGQQRAPRQGPLGRVAAQVEDDPLVRRPVRLLVPGQQPRVHRGRPLGALQQGAQPGHLGRHVRWAGVPVHTGQHQHPAHGAPQPYPAAVRDDERHPRVPAAALRVAGPQGQQGPARQRHGAVPYGQAGRRAGQVRVQADAGGGRPARDVLDDHVVGARDEHPALPAPAGRPDHARREGHLPPVPRHTARPRRRPAPAHAHRERRVEGAHPAQRKPVREAVARRSVPGQQPVLKLREASGEPGRAGVGGRDGPDQRVMGDDHPLVVGIAVDEGAVAAVAAQERVLPARRGPRLPRTVHRPPVHRPPVHRPPCTGPPCAGPASADPPPAERPPDEPAPDLADPDPADLAPDPDTPAPAGPPPGTPASRSGSVLPASTPSGPVRSAGRGPPHAGVTPPPPAAPPPRTAPAAARPPRPHRTAGRGRPPEPGPRPAPARG